MRSVRLFIVAALLLFPPLLARAQQQQQDDDNGSPMADQIEAARQLLQSGAQIPPEAQKYLEAHPELKEQLIEGAKKKASEENKERPARTSSQAVRPYENLLPASPKYDWRRSPYLSTLFAKRLTPQEAQTATHFGHELFDPRPGGAQVLEDMPVSPSYVLGPGDQIIVKTWGRLEGTNRMTVDRDGRIFYPKIGSIYVAGKTFGELKQLLQGKIGKIAEVKFEVSLGELKASRVSVVGEVRAPGWYNVSSLHTALQALYLAGGVKDIGSMRQIELRRDGKVAARIDLYEFMLHGDNRADIRLLPGDTIFVPVAGKTVAVVGDVRRPALYELSSEKTLLAAIRMAGDFSAAAFTRRVQVERLDAHTSSIVLDVDTAQLEKGKDKFELEDGDVVRVLPIVDSDENVLTVEGNVRRPGRYQVKPGLTVGTLFPDEKSFLPETWFDYALLTRLVPPDLHKELIAVNLRAIVLEKRASADVALQGRDTLKVFPRTAFKDVRRVTISGEVRRNAPEVPTAEEAQEANAPRNANAQPRMRPRAAKAEPPDVQKAEAERAFVAKQETEKAAFEKELALRPLNAEQRQRAIKIFESKQAEDKQQADAQLAERQGEAEQKEAPLAHDADELTFDIPETTRLADLVTLAGGLTRDALLSRAEVVRIDDQRNAHTFYVDLGKAMAGDPENNLLLQDQDRVRIHSIWETRVRRTVSAAGEVKDPGDYLLTEGMKLTDLIFKAGGFTEGGFAGQAELVRRTVMPDGSLVKTQTLVVSPAKAMEGDAAADVPLLPYDQLVVRQIPDWMARIRVALAGEVRFPGVYAVPKGERLSAIVARAGGFTREAYLHAAQFTRESTRQAQQAAIDRLTQELELSITEKAQEAAAALDKEDIESNRDTVAARRNLVNQLRLARAQGRVIIHLPDDGKLAGTPADILLENGDRLEIPKKMNVVNVVGRVYNPTGIVFDPDNSKASHYLDAVGGPMESADSDHIFVLRADGTVASGSSGIFGRSIQSVGLEPGDSIIVPEKLIQPRFLKDFRDITQIIFQLALSTAVVLHL